MTRSTKSAALIPSPALSDLPSVEGPERQGFGVLSGMEKRGDDAWSIPVSDALRLPSLRRHGPRQLYSEGRVSFDDTGRYVVPAFYQCRAEKGRQLRDSVVLFVVHCQRQNRDECEHAV